MTDNRIFDAGRGLSTENSSRIIEQSASYGWVICTIANLLAIIHDIPHLLKRKSILSKGGTVQQFSGVREEHTVEVLLLHIGGVES